MAGEERILPLGCAAARPPPPALLRLVAEAMGETRPSGSCHIRLARMVSGGYFSTIFWCAPDTPSSRQALEQQRLEPDRDYNPSCAWACRTMKKERPRRRRGVYARHP